MSENSLKPAALRELESEELQTQLTELKEELFNLRFKHHTGQLENFMQIPKVRKSIARIKTILHARQQEAS
jgi:large subunit ribosomal protein L29